MTTTTQPTTTTTAALLDSLAAAIEANDATTVAAHYAPGATLSLLDRDHPPADPTISRGRRDRGVLPRHLRPQHGPPRRRPGRAPDRIAFTQHCRYPSGQRVVCIAVAPGSGTGSSSTRPAVQVWDA